MRTQTAIKYEPCGLSYSILPFDSEKKIDGQMLSVIIH